jgi:hypothetical protein
MSSKGKIIETMEESEVSKEIMWNSIYQKANTDSLKSYITYKIDKHAIWQQILIHKYA